MIKILPSLSVLMVTLVLAACSTTPVHTGEPIEPVYSADRVLIKDADTADKNIYDPWEGFNRRMYRFNYYFDKYVFLPGVQAYQAILPDVAEKGVRNFLKNIGNIRTLINSVLQLSPQKTVETTARLFANTTFGLLGLIDVASMWDMAQPEEDFGQTLGYWGVGSGPYLVLPILGPSSVRDSTGTVADWWAFREIDVLNLDDHEQRAWIYIVVYGLDMRAQIAFRYYESGSPYEYELVRMLYTTKRKLDIER